MSYTEPDYLSNGCLKFEVGQRIGAEAIETAIAGNTGKIILAGAIETTTVENMHGAGSVTRRLVPDESVGSTRGLFSVVDESIANWDEFRECLAAMEPPLQVGFKPLYEVPEEELRPVLQEMKSVPQKALFVTISPVPEV